MLDNGDYPTYVPTSRSLTFLKLTWLPVVTPPPNGPARRSQQKQDGTDNEQDDSEGPKDRNTKDEAEYQQNYSENNHASYLPSDEHGKHRRRG